MVDGGEKETLKLCFRVALEFLRFGCLTFRAYTHIKELLPRSVHLSYEKLSAKTSGYVHCKKSLSFASKNYCTFLQFINNVYYNNVIDSQ